LPLGPEEFYPSYLLEVLLRDLNESETAGKREALVELARNALDLERTYLLGTVDQQVEAAEERLEQQIKAKRSEAELALEGLENEAQENGVPLDARAAYRLVGEALGVTLNPSPAELKEFDFGR